MKAGTRIGGKYRLVRPLGEGGMGVVWAAINELTEREVALKLLRGLDASEDARLRLLREARACGRIVHRNVVEIYDVGQTDAGDPFLVMEMLSGETVGEKLVRERKIVPAVALRIAAETARGLKAAHTARVMHRDLKPSNLFLHEEPGGEAPVLKILDFGVSKTLQQGADFTATGKTMGSPAYMSPEQVRGLKTVDHRTDLWSVGVVLAELLSGRRVFQGLTPYGAAAEVLSGRIRGLSDLMPDADPRIAAVVDRCLQRDVDKRWSTADELLEALTPLLGDDRPGLTPAAAMKVAPPPSIVPAPPPLPVMTGINAIADEVTSTEFAPPPMIDETTSAYAVPLDMRDTVRPAPISMPPSGAHGLPILGRDSAPPDEQDVTHADSIPAGLIAAAAEEAASSSGAVPVVLWDDYLRKKSEEVPDAPLAESGSQDAALVEAVPKPRRAVYAVAGLALVALVAFLVVIMAR
ncbi:serine/threonine-protein kinase [Polyangium sorediatum]|uniref:Serine/threonine-protein kinase n=1 Tax=Polyangium sorediatum TaxID=889274 RepID=A0ABT6PAC5_9BACT|nr:serine/threonine-protein kinase [Polyangium sorediatum]MDI1437576.1 serine/threonine-protein kinase [Polyangium sorediatum]